MDEIGSTCNNRSNPYPFRDKLLKFLNGPVLEHKMLTAGGWPRSWEWGDMIPIPCGRHSSGWPRLEELADVGALRF